MSLPGKRRTVGICPLAIMIRAQLTVETSTAYVEDADDVAADSRYIVRLARSSSEIESALRLRYEVFRVELAGIGDAAPFGLEYDEYDARSRHLIVVEKTTGRTVGTYRLNSLETVGSVNRFYSYSEFTIEDMPLEVVGRGIEIGRACIATEHRNTKVLFLLWKGLANYLVRSEKRFFFGCCSIFTWDLTVAERAFHQLAERGHFHPGIKVEPRKNALYLASAPDDGDAVELPGLFEMYLRIGAKVCGPPTIDHDFGSVDFFVVFDVQAINEKYRRMFFA